MIAGALIAAVLLAAPVAPQPMVGFFDAAQLNRYCEATGEALRDGRTICLSYITGAADQILIEQAQGHPNQRTICMPGDATAAEVMKAVTTHATWSRSSRGVSAASFVRYALEQAYPCNPDGAEIM